MILKTLSVFTNKFPELAILHVPTLMEELASRPLSSETMALLSAVLAVSRGQLAVLGASWADVLLSREEYAIYTRDMLSQFILQPPKLQVVQMLLVITLYEWGTRNFHKAWVYCGTFQVFLIYQPWPSPVPSLTNGLRHRYPHHAGTS